MTEYRPLVVDANIILRAVFGNAVRALFEQAEDAVALATPVTCIAEAERHIPQIAQKRSLDIANSMRVLGEVVKMIGVIDDSFYRAYEPEAWRRIGSRDPDDCPVLATALLLRCPVWTEDRDFFGTGVATWTTRNVGIYLRAG